MARSLRKLTEGFSGEVATAVRQFFARSPEMEAADIQRGGIPPSDRAGLPFSLANQFGMGALGQHLQLDQSLQARYSDCEEMDEYGAISCLVGSSLVFTLEWGWRRIDDLVGEEEFHVLSYDRDRKSLVPVRAEKAIVSAPEGHGKPMVRVVLDSGVEVVCTADHPFLTKDEKWVEAGDLTPKTRLMSGGGSNIAPQVEILGMSAEIVKNKAQERGFPEEPGNHRVVRVEHLTERPAVYDLTVPGYHNFVCHGVVVHNTAYDIYADDAAMPDMERGQSIWVVSDNRTVEDDLNEMLHKQVLIEEHIWGLERTIGKYGNAFGEVLVSDRGVIGINFLPPPTVRRVEDYQGRLLGFVQDVRGEFNLSIEDFYKLAAQRGTDAEKSRMPGVLTVFEDWEVVHWRLRGKHLSSAYGNGVGDPARWVWKRLVLLEDAILIYKLSRAPARYAFYVDIGEYDNERGLAFVNRVKNEFTKKKFINPCLTGDTLVQCLDGTMRSMREMAEEGSDRWVYSFDLSRGKVVPGLAKNPRKTGDKVPIYRVVLDNGSVVRATGHHPFLMRDGVYRDCDQLRAGDRLMPLNLCRTNRGRGYIRVKQPLDGQQEYVHTLVAKELWPEKFDDLEKPIVHHGDRVKSNNDPANLEVGERSDHAREYLDENLEAARAAYVRRVKTDSEFGAEVADRLAAWRSRDPERVRRVMSEHGRKNMEARVEKAAPLHEQMLGIITGVVERDPLITAQELVAELNRDKRFLEIYGALPTTQKPTMSVGCFQAWLKRQGFRYYKEFKKSVVGYSCWRNSKYERRVGKGNNHRVVDVRFDGYEDVYNMDVEKYANFALVSGVFVHNSTGKMDMRYNPLSHDEDIFIPSRGGKDSTRVEVLQGPDYSETETVEYHRDSLVSALKVPKNYMGFGGESSRSALSSEDIRFARTVMRLQRETRTGARKVCRIHLVAKGADADRHEYDVKMSVPSAILELAKIEVMSATADLAQRMGELLSSKWILTALFKYSEEEAESLIKDKDTDAIRKAKVEAEAQRLMMMAQNPPEAGGGGMGAEVPGGAEAEKGVEAGTEKEKGGEAEPGGGGGPEMASAVLRRDMLMMERRIGRMLQRHQEHLERTFDRKTRLSRNADKKIAEALQTDPALAKRLRNVQGLLKDLKNMSGNRL